MSLGSMKFEVNSDTGFVTVGYGAGSSPTFTRVLAGNGTAAAPSYSFTNDSNTGFYIVSGAPDILYFTSGSTNALRFTGSPAGTGYIYAGANNNYLELSANGFIQLVAAGTNQFIGLTPSGHATVGGLTLSRLTSTSQTLALLNFGSDELMHIVGVGYAGSGSRTNVPYILYSNNVERCRIMPASGNLLIATTTDNTLGKLQISGSLTAAEAFGTGLFGYFGGSDLVVGTLNATQVVFRTNNTAAITIDGSQNVTFSKNLFLGTNGPSVSSTLNARASRQGLVFNGTRGVSVTGSPFNFGTGDFTIAFRVRRDSSATQQYLIGNDIFACFYAGFRVGGNLFSGLVGGSPNADLNLANEVGKEQHIVLTRSGTTLTCYANGVSVGTTTDSNNYNGSAFTLFAADGGGSSAFVGMGIIEGVYNRALSAAEVVSLYQSGIPSQADYGIPGAVPASNTGLVGDAFSNFQYDTFTGATTSGFTAVETGGQACQATTGKTTGTYLGIASVGTRYLVTFTATLTSGAGPVVAIGKSTVGLVSNIGVVVNGANSHVLTLTAALTAENSANSGNLYFTSTGNTNYTISNFSVKRLGVTLVPDANQPGGGLYWYDASGNSSTLTRVATGSSWNVPTSGYNTQIASRNADIGFLGQNSSQGTASSTSIELQNENGPGYSIGLRYFGNSFTQVNAYRANRGLLYGSFDLNFLSGQYKFWFGGGGTGTNNAVAYEGFNIYGPSVSTGTATILFTTAATDTISGAFQVRGGMGIQGSIYVGGDIVGNTNLVFVATSSTNGNVYLRGKGTGYVRVDTGSGFRVEAGKVSFTSLPTSSAGLSAGDLWNDSGTVKIV
jgi:hypothetical protein